MALIELVPMWLGILEGSQPVEVEGNGGKEGIRSDGLPVEIAATRDMEAVFVCKISSRSENRRIFITNHRTPL